MHQIQKLVPLLLLPVFLLTLRPALASENTGDLTIRCAVERNGTTDELAGDRFHLVPVAEGKVEWADGTAGLHCRTVSAFAPFDCNWNRLTALESRQTAAALADAAGGIDAGEPGAGADRGRHGDEQVLCLRAACCS